MKDLLIKIKNIPAQKHNVPLILVGLVKKVIVLCGPKINTRPMMKSMLLNANKAESKNVIIPKMKKKIPPAVNPTPNSSFVNMINYLNAIGQS